MWGSVLNPSQILLTEAFPNHLMSTGESHPHSSSQPQIISILALFLVCNYFLVCFLGAYLQDDCIHFAHWLLSKCLAPSRHLIITYLMKKWTDQSTYCSITSLPSLQEQQGIEVGPGEPCGLPSPAHPQCPSPWCPPRKTWIRSCPGQDCSSPGGSCWCSRNRCCRLREEDQRRIREGQGLRSRLVPTVLQRPPLLGWMGFPYLGEAGHKAQGQ